MRTKKQYTNISNTVVFEAQSGNQASILEIVKILTPLICKMTKHWGIEYKQDAMQTGALAISIALTKYKSPHYNIPFNVFVIPYLKTELSAEFCRIKGVPQRPMREYQKALFKQQNQQQRQQKQQTLKNGIRVDCMERFLNMLSYESAIIDSENMKWLV